MGFGVGIGLSGQPPLYDRLLLARQRQQADKSAAEAEKKRAKDDADYNRFAGKLFVDGSKYHRTLLGEAEKTALDGMERMAKSRDTNPNSWMGEANKIAVETLSKLGMLQRQTAKFDALEKLTPSTYMQAEAQKALRTENDWRKVGALVANDPSGSVIQDRDGFVDFGYVNPGKNLPKELEAAVNDANNFIKQSISLKNISPEFAKVYEISSVPKDAAQAKLIQDEIFKNTGQLVNVPNAEDIGKRFAANPDYLLQYKVDNPNLFWDFLNGKNLSGGIDKENAVAAQKIVDLAKSMAQTRVNMSLRNRPKEEKGTGTRWNGNIGTSATGTYIINPEGLQRQEATPEQIEALTNQYNNSVSKIKEAVKAAGKDDKGNPLLNEKEQLKKLGTLDEYLKKQQQAQPQTTNPTVALQYKGATENPTRNFVDGKGKTISGSPNFFEFENGEWLLNVVQKEDGNSVSKRVPLLDNQGVNLDNIVADYGEIDLNKIDVGKGRQTVKTETSSVPKKTVVKKFHNKGTNQTKLVYSDGTEEIVSGLQ